MYHTTAKTLTARAAHRCTNCGESIDPGQLYARWVSLDDSAYTNKMHPECLQSLIDDASGLEFEYSPYSGERPELQSTARDDAASAA